MTLTNYATIKQIRSESGFKPQRMYRDPVGKGDGSRLEFALNYSGGAKHDVVVSRDQLGSVGDADVDVYLGAASFTREDDANYTLDPEEGTITFNSAPNVNVQVFVTYWHSVISDDEIEECITWADDYINRETYQSFYTGGDTKDTYNDIFDGDGINKEFRLSRGRIFSLDSYDIDGTTSGLTQNEDYYLYPEENRIVLQNAPANDKRNVSFTYSYGVPINATVQELARIIAAMKAIGLGVNRTGKTGVATGKGSKRSFRESNRPVTSTKLLRERAEMNFKSIGYKVRVDFLE